MHRVVLFFLLISCANFHPFHAATAGYIVSDLGAFPSSFSQSRAFAINAVGQVVGDSIAQVDGGGHNIAFLWQDGFLSNLGTLPGNTDSIAFSLNSLGMVVGSSVGGSSPQRAFLWQNGIMTDLGVLPDMTAAYALAINSSGKVVGLSYNELGGRRAFLWQGGAITDLGDLPSGGTRLIATGINNVGQVVGYGEDSAGTAFLWQNGLMTELFGLHGDTRSFAFAINSSGNVVGLSEGSSSRGVVWSNGLIAPLGALPNTVGSVALAINDSDLIVGRSILLGQTDQHATLWDNRTAIDLNSQTLGSGWTLIEASGVNNNGQIVGWGINPDGNTHAYLLNPTTPQQVLVDIKPGSDPNCFNVDGNGVIPVAVLGSDSFDVTQIDVATLNFAGLAVRVRGNDNPQCSIEDVSGDFTTPEGAPDGFDDLVCQFVDDPGTWVPNDDNTATLTGELIDGTPFEGTDSICIVP